MKLRASRATGVGQLAFLVALSLFALPACDRSQIRSYRVPKSNDSLAASDNSGGDAISNPQRAAAVKWTVPSGWTEIKSDQPMRVATFQAAGAEVTVAAFPGSVGGTLANVNRWRGQIGLQPASEADLASLLINTQVGNTKVSLMSMTGSAGQIMLAAIVLPGDDQTWFVKSVTDATKAAALMPDFQKFASSFRLDAAQAAPASSPAPAAPAASTPAAGPSAVDTRLAKWTPPLNWKSEKDSSGFLAATFAATNADGDARATAASLLGEGGGMLPNLNRWRDQLGLPPLADLAQQPSSELGPRVPLFDLSNQAGTDRMLVAVVPAGQSTWFFKLRGSVKGVEAERAAFIKFVQAVGLGS